MHFVIDDIESFVEAHAGFDQHAHRAGGKRKVHAGTGGNVGFVAGTALVGLHAVLVAVEHGFDDVVDATQIRRFDLRHVAAFRVSEVDHVLDRIAPFVGNQFDLRTQLAEAGFDLAQRIDLCVLGAHVDRPLDVKLEVSGSILELGDVIGDLDRVLVKNEADGAIDVDMQRRVVVGAGFERIDALGQPADVIDEFFAFKPQFFRHVVDQRMRHRIDTLQDHLVDRRVTVIPALAEQWHRLKNGRQLVFIEDDFGLGDTSGQRRRIKQGLCQAIADRCVQPLAFDFQCVEVTGIRQEGADVAPFEQGFHVLFEEGGKIVTEEQRIASARAGILHRRAITDGHCTVIEDEQHGNAFAALANLGEARRHRLADINKTIMPRAFLDRLLVVEVKRGIAGNEQGFLNFHGKAP